MKAPFHSEGYDESLNGPDLTFRRPVDFSSRKSSRKECFAPFFAGRSICRAEKVHGKSASHQVHGLGAVDGAPSTCCAKHSSVNFFDFSSAASHARKILESPSEGLRRPPGASRRLSEDFSRKMKIFNFSSFFMKVQYELVFCHGRGKFLNNFI